MFACFFLQMSFFLFNNTDYSMVKMTSYSLNPNLVLNLYTAVVLQSMITFIINYLFIKILLGCFFCSSTSSNLCFLWFEMYFAVVIWKFYNLILFPYVLHWTTVFHHCLIVILYHFLYVCLLISTLYYIPLGFQDFLFLLSSHCILLTHFLLKQIRHD